ncbi:ATP-binding protein [Caulobacter sp. 17J80-11]|uniref:sensor histidine kinase n=1 Tax=Caulobacter sp. 17J80-11 TaxID=2763502 RepID=UPI00351C7C7A
MPLWVRVTVLCAALGLTAATVFYARELYGVPRDTRPADRTELNTRAELAAARLSADIAAARAALRAGGERLTASPGAPLDAAELAMRAASGSAEGVAIVSIEGDVLATTGKTAGWSDAATSARTSQAATWTGAAGGRAWTAVRAGGEAWLLAATPTASAVAGGAAPDLVVLAAPDGRVLASSDAELTGRSLDETLSLSIADARATFNGGEAEAKRPQGGDLRAAGAQTAEGGFLAVAAEPARAGAGPFARVLPLALLAIGGALTLLVWAVARRAGADRRAFADTERRYRTAVEAARCGVWEWDLRADEVYVSEVLAVILGWRTGGVVKGDALLDKVAPDHRPRVLHALKSAAAYGAFDVTFRAPGVDGRSTWIEARGQAVGERDEDGYSRIVGVALDVTEERSAQSRARAAEARLRDAVESASEAFVLWNRQGRLVMSNQTFRDWFGFEQRVLKPGAPRDAIMQIAQLAVRQEAAAPDGRPGVREAELHDGRWLQISERTTADGGAVITAADITAVKRQEDARRRNEEELHQIVERLEQSQAELAVLARKYEAAKTKAEGANRAKSEFLANMSHELRTPLNAINGFSEIMVGEMYGPLGDRRYREYAQDIHNSGQHLLALINDILDMAKIEAGKMTLRFEPVSIEEVAEDAMRLVRNRAETAGLQLRLDLPATLPDVEADYRAFKQVLLNLLSNAVKFTPRGGSVTLAARSAGGGVRVSVTDTGIGISKEDLQRLARPFEQVESQHAKTQQGSGLGLALTKSLVELHQGRLELESEPGRGTTAHVILPVNRPQAEVHAA